MVHPTGRKGGAIVRKLIINEQLSVDGVMQGPGQPDEDRSGGFEHGGWAMPYSDEIMGKAAGEGMGTADGLLLGRKTYERSEEHTSELQSQSNLVCRLLLEKKEKRNIQRTNK